MDGIHLLGEWYGCPADEPLLTQADALRDLCRQAVDDSGLTIVGDSFFQFEPQGVTGRSRPSGDPAIEDLRREHAHPCRVVRGGQLE